ncbi:MAG: hypothetical protein ACXWXR_09750 [Candidatus Limnocylindrales bacterium]
MTSGGATRPTTELPVPRRVATVLLSWLAMLGVDFFLHAGLLAPLYDWDSPFLLRPEQAFLRIPIGYLGLLILAIALAWLLPRFNVGLGRDGALIAGAFGAVAWGALLLGLWSISTADPGLLAGWWVGQTVELGLGGYVIGSVHGGARVRAVAGKVGLVLVVGAISAVVLQAIGYAAAPVVIR